MENLTSVILQFENLLQCRSAVMALTRFFIITANLIVIESPTENFLSYHRSENFQQNSW